MREQKTIFINGQQVLIKPKSSFTEVMLKFGAVPPFAILLNEHFIPASQHQNIKLQANDQIEVISAIQGG